MKSETQKKLEKLKARYVRRSRQAAIDITQMDPDAIDQDTLDLQMLYASAVSVNTERALFVDAVVEKLINEGLVSASNYISLVRENKVRNGTRIDRHIFNELAEIIEIF